MLNIKVKLNFQFVSAEHIYPFYPNVVPAPESHRSVASLISSQDHIPFGRLFSCHIPNVPLDRQRDGRKVAFWNLRFFLICGGSYQITELLKNHPPQVVGIENPEKTTPYVKQKYGKEGGRTYYHIVQSFAPDDDLTPETAHEIGLKFAEHFPSYQILVATHYNTGHIHNHLIMNSVNYQNGKKFHQTRDELLEVKEYSNKLCQEYGLSITEEKCSYGRWPEWKKLLRRFALYAISNSDTKEEFIACMCEHGYRLKWEDKYKYITFTTPDNHVCRDKSLFDERLLKDNLEVYFALGGASSELYDDYNDYKTPAHTPEASMTVTTGLISLLGDLLSIAPPEDDYEPHPAKELSIAEKLRLEKILGKKISPMAYACYSTQEEYEQGMSMVW